MGLGTNRVTNTPAARQLLHRAADLGVDFIDTADFYQASASESTLGEIFGRNAAPVLVATKGGMYRTPDGAGVDGSPEYLRKAVAASLERLRVDALELYQLHRVDPAVPIETSVGALRELQEAGRIRRIGLSNVSVDELQRARRIAPIVSVQNRYNLAEREQEPVLRFCEEHSIAFLPWTPLARGKLDQTPTLREIAVDYGVTPHQLALRWLLRRSPWILPIPGTLSEAHLAENLAAAEIDLSSTDFQRLERMRPPAGS